MSKLLKNTFIGLIMAGNCFFLTQIALDSLDARELTGSVYCCKEKIEEDPWCKSFSEEGYDYCCEELCPEDYPIEVNDSLCGIPYIRRCKNADNQEMVGGFGCFWGWGFGYCPSWWPHEDK